MEEKGPEHLPVPTYLVLDSLTSTIQTLLNEHILLSLNSSLSEKQTQV